MLYRLPSFFDVFKYVLNAGVLPRTYFTVERTRRIFPNVIWLSDIVAEVLLVVVNYFPYGTFAIGHFAEHLTVVIAGKGFFVQVLSNPSKVVRVVFVKPLLVAFYSTFVVFDEALDVTDYLLRIFTVGNCRKRCGGGLAFHWWWCF